MPSWSTDLETGHRNIDAEHQHVCAMLDAIEATLGEQTNRPRDHQLIVALQEYVLHHFAREEAYMLRVGCPSYQANARAHGEFTQRFTDWINVLTIGHPSESLVEDIHRQAAAWIKAHIQNCDCSLRQCRSR
jgi:hemerythrin